MAEFFHRLLAYESIFSSFGAFVGHDCTNTHRLFNDTLSRVEIRTKPLITTDGFTFYERVIRKLFGIACSYAQVIKTWRKNRVIKVERRAVIGSTRQLEKALLESEDSSQANTSFIERLNLTVRRCSAYLARRSTAHAHHQEKLNKHLDLVRCYYNFIRRHQALRFGPECRTPAMVAGLTEKVLAFRDIFQPVQINS